MLLDLIKLIKPSNTTSVVFDGLISLIKFKSKYNGMENIKNYVISFAANDTSSNSFFNFQSRE